MPGLSQPLILALALVSFGTALPSPHKNAGADASAKGQGCQAQTAKPQMAATGKALYFITNDAQNAVVALPIGKDGKLSKGSMTKTGGAGSIAVDAMKKPAVPDALVGQSALTMVGNNIFAVNAGSNTVSMLMVSASDPTKLQVVGKAVAVPGEFPNTVAASMKNKLVCVGMTGAKAGVSCAPFSSKGIGQMDDLRAFDIGQSTPPVGPTNTVSQVFFNNDESMLFTTVKGDPAVNNTGFLSAVAVQGGGKGQAKVAAKDTRSSPKGTAVLFGSAPIPGKQNQIFATDASFGAAILDVDGQVQASLKASQAIDGQKATCWAAISAKTNSAFVTDVGVNRVVEMSLDDARIISQIDLSANGNPGLIDLKSAGSFIYALSPGNATQTGAITVLDVSGGQKSMKEAQNFKLDGIAPNTAMGMAVML